MSAPTVVTDLVERGVVAMGAVGAVVVAGARPRLPGAASWASRRAALAICPTRGRRSIGEGARAAARGRVAASGPRAQVDDRGRFTLGVEAAQRRHGGIRAGSGEIREASDPVRDLPAG